MLDNQLVTLSKIFTERLFRIPDYQRGYAWTEKQLKDFWSDLEQLDLDRNHYTGVLTLEAVPKDIVEGWNDDSWIILSKKYEPYFVVDSQQRLTTVIILIQVILEQIADGSKLNYTDKEDIRKKFIFDSKDDMISRSYIFGYEERDKSFNFLKTRIFCEKSLGPIEETVYTQNLESAKKYLVDRVSVMTSDDLQILYRKVTQNLLFNIFTISEDVDVCVAFETMNNRGKPLSQLELLKNRLIYLSIKVDEVAWERQALRKAINECWRTIYHNLGRNRSRPLDDDAFLYTHYVTYFPSDPEEILEYGYRRVARNYSVELLEKLFIPKNVSKDAPLESKLSVKSIYDYVHSLEDSIKTWYNIFNPAQSDYGAETKIWLDKLQRIEAKPYLPLVLIFLRKVSDESRRVQLLSAIERRILVTSLLDRYSYAFSSDEYGNFSIALAESLAKGDLTAEKVIKQVNDLTNGLIKSDKFQFRITDAVKNRGFYHWSHIRYFLYEYDLDLKSRSKTDRDKINWSEFTENYTDYITVEHIYPQHARSEYWVKRFASLKQNQKVGHLEEPSDFGMMAA